MVTNKGFPSPKLGLSLKCECLMILDTIYDSFRPLNWGYL